jgi:uncharacterized protein
MKEAISAALQCIERAENLRVLLAVESGSRAWGFASPTADWDVRFLYIRPPEWYLTIQPRSEVVERKLDGDLDVSGWDLKKALALFAKPNMPLLEWLRSPIVYVESSSAASRLRALSAQYFSARACLHHYLNMAEGNNRNHLRGDRIRLKDYFYVLRPVLACRWIEAHETMPPMGFSALVEDQLPTPLRSAADALLIRKCSGEELVAGPRVPEVNDFLDSEIARIGSRSTVRARQAPPDIDLLDTVFRATLREVWGDLRMPSDCPAHG